MTGKPIATQLWERFGRITADDLPADVLTVATQCITDWFACAVAGGNEPLVTMLCDEFAEYTGPCSVVGRPLRLPPGQAALVNGAMGHALDFDDTHPDMGGHPTVPLFPAALAMAEALDRSGADLVAAFVAGLEIESAIGLGIGREHYAKGWHQTSTIGIFGATAAVAHLMGLDAEQFGRALGLAASQSSGLKANFGTMAKPFHAGHAAERGLLSARLAARGFTANPDAIDTNQGMAQAAGNGLFDRERMCAYESAWLIRSTLFKYHAACYLTHASIEAIASIRADRSEVDEVVLCVNPSILNVCGIAQPRTGLEAKFSLRATSAMTLLGYDTTDPAVFTDSVVQDPTMQATILKVRVETDTRLRTTESAVTLRSEIGDRSATYDSGVPAEDLVKQGARLLAKFTSITEPVVGADRSSALLAALGRITALPRAAGLFSYAS